MNGQIKKYRESLANTPGPVLLTEEHNKLDLKGLMSYAARKGEKVINLSEEEKNMFMRRG